MDAFLLLNLDFLISDTGLVTQRVLKNTWIIFVGALLGSVFGIMGSIASVMGVVENVVEKVKGKHEKHIEFKRVLDYRRNLGAFCKKGEDQKLDYTTRMEGSRKKHLMGANQHSKLAVVDD